MSGVSNVAWLIRLTLIMEHSELWIALRSAGAPRATAFAGYNAHSGCGCQDVELALLIHLPHDRPPQALFAANELSGLFGCQVARVGAEHLKPLDHLGHGHDLAEICIDLLDDELRRARRRHQHDPPAR